MMELNSLGSAQKTSIKCNATSHEHSTPARIPSPTLFFHAQFGAKERCKSLNSRTNV